ncbi:calcium-binding protein PBP1-like [Silene latifolia]|uniref:calcium-binding protein PBP1-like n=1 Tax=Silene latifolia TaxID=37657 RepID=UPI003D773812
MAASTSKSVSNTNEVEFEDFLPSMVEKLGEEGFMEELSNGFRLLKDEKKGMITFESLKRNSAVLGLGEMTEDELREMLKEGDVDGDGCLSKMEFFVLMFRLSPGLMEDSRRWLQQALATRRSA